VRERGNIILEGPGLILPDGGSRSIGSNLRKWVSFDNGAQKIADWHGEKEVVLLGYDPIKTATFTTKRDIGPTASAICSEIHLQSSSACVNISDSRYWYHDSGYYNPVQMQSNFTAGGNSGNDNSKKPGKVQMLIGVWFEYDGPLNPVASANGVFEIGIGGGDLVYVKNLTTNGTAWFFAQANELISSSAGPPQSTGWCGDNNGATPPFVTWLEMTGSESDLFEISIRPPGWGHDPPQGGADINASPGGLRYYLTVYVVEGCESGGELIRGDMIPVIDLPVHDRLKNHVQGVSDSGIIL